MFLVRAIRQLANTLRGEARVDGIRLPLDRSVLSARMWKRLAATKYEAREVRQSAAAVRPGDTVLELGAGLGFVSSYMRKHTRAGRLVCVEANPDLIPYIRHVHQLNNIDDVQVIHAVAMPSEDVSSVPFYCRDDFWSSSLDPMLPYRRVVEVAGIPLGRLISEYKPSLLIMDIEGGERQLLSIEALEGIRCVVLEVHPKIYGTSGLEEVQRHLARLSFRLAPENGKPKVMTYHRAGA